MAGRIPAPKGPYAPWVKAGNHIFVSGQGPVDAATGEPNLSDIRTQTRMTLENVKVVLEDAGAGLGDVIKTTVFLTDIGDFQKMNEVYSGFFGDVKPARSCVQVAALPLGISVEIEAIALDPSAGIEVTRTGG